MWRSSLFSGETEESHDQILVAVIDVLAEIHIGNLPEVRIWKIRAKKPDLEV
jgi:hypothetical protein